MEQIDVLPIIHHKFYNYQDWSCRLLMLRTVYRKQRILGKSGHPFFRTEYNVVNGWFC